MRWPGTFAGLACPLHDGRRPWSGGAGGRRSGGAFNAYLGNSAVEQAADGRLVLVENIDELRLRVALLTHVFEYGGEDLGLYLERGGFRGREAERVKDVALHDVGRFILPCAFHRTLVPVIAPIRTRLVEYSIQKTKWGQLVGNSSEVPELVERSDGVHTFKLERWNEFHDFIERIVFDGESASSGTFIWRGQRDSDWSLSTTLDRLLQRLSVLPSNDEHLERISARHLRSFQLATRGRRGNNPARLEDIEWWALGQHFGLATPLLDWTRSPFAAAYFAFEELGSAVGSPFRAIYALDLEALEEKNDELAEGPSLERGRPPLVQVIDSLSNENARLVSQGGLFTRAPIAVSVESWVSQFFESSEEPVLLKILIPNDERLSCLRGLDRMNISHSSLFPDLAGASRATNLKLELFPELLRF